MAGTTPEECVILLAEGDDTVAGRIAEALTSYGQPYRLERVASLAALLERLSLDHTPPDVSIVAYRLPDSLDPDATLREACTAVELVGVPMVGLIDDDDLERAAVQLRDCAVLYLHRDELTQLAVARVVKVARARGQMSGRGYNMHSSAGLALQSIRRAHAVGQGPPTGAIEVLFGQLDLKLTGILAKTNDLQAQLGSLSRRIRALEDVAARQTPQVAATVQLLSRSVRHVKRLDRLMRGDDENGQRSFEHRLCELERGETERAGRDARWGRRAYDLTLALAPHLFQAVLAMAVAMLAWFNYQYRSAATTPLPDVKPPAAGARP